MKKFILFLIITFVWVNLFSQGTTPCIWNGSGTPTFNGGKDGCMVVYHASSDSTWVWDGSEFIINKSNSTSKLLYPNRIIVGDTTYTFGDTILWYGNSITRGSQADQNFTFPRLVSYGLNCTPDIRAIDGTGLYGATCADSNMVCRLPSVPDYTTNIRYICFLYGPQGSSLDTIVDYATYRAKYYQVIDSIESKGYPTEKIVIISWVHTKVTGGGFINPRIVSLQDSIAQERGVNFVNAYQAMLNNGGDILVAPDNIHTNTAGHSVIAQAFFDSLGLITSGYFYSHGNVDVAGNLNIQGESTFAGGAVFDGSLEAGARLTGRASVSDETGIEMISNQPGLANKSWIELKHTLSADTWRLTQTVGASYVNTFSIDHGVNPMLGFSNDNKMSLFGSVAPSSLLGSRFTLYGDMQMTERLSIWGRPTYNNQSLLDLRNPQFAGGSYIDVRMFSATQTDTMRIRNQIISGSESLFGIMRNNNYIYMYRGDTGNTTIGSNTDQGYKLAVVGATGISGEKYTARPLVNNISVLDFRNPTFAVNSYIEQKFWTHNTTDTLRLRQIVVSGGDQHLRLMRNSDIGLNIGSNGSGLTGVGVGNITTPTARLHLAAGTATANTAPLKIESGVLMTTPEAKAIENDGTRLYWTNNTPTRRHLLDLPTATPTTNHIPIFDGTNWTTGSVSTTLNLDIYRLPAINEYLFASGLNANESVTNYNFSNIDQTKYKFSTTALGTSSTEFGGWLANGTSGDSIAISAPFGVVIGDSQAEGHPARHGRLHPNGVATFSANYQDTLGTISYTLRQLTRMRWFNHGIGGQTSDQVWARWSRDVLANTFDPSDGRGSKTLERKPNVVIVIVGINDFYVYPTRSWHITKENLENMARSARDNGIAAVFLNCPGDEIITLEQARKVDSLNIWMASGALQAFGAVIVDYNSWWRDPTYNDNAHGNSLIVDDIHPTIVGYDSLANVIFRTVKLPVITGIKFTNQLSPTGFSGYSRPTNITIQGVSHTISSDQQLIPFSTPLEWDSTWIHITSSTNITGTTYTGFSHIEWLIANDTTNIYTRKNALYNSYQGTTGALFSRTGNIISPSTITDRLAIGVASAGATTTMLTIQGTTTDATVHTRMQSSAGLNPIVFTNNGRIGINRTGASYNLHVAGTASFEASSSDYWYFNGSASEVYGSSPRFRFQSTSLNTGGTGRTDMDMIWNGSTFTIAPSPSAPGADFRYIIRNLASNWFFDFNLSTKRFSIGPTSGGALYGVDFTGITDGLALPRGTTAQRGTTGGLNPIRFNTDSTQVEISPSNGVWNYIPRSAYPLKTSGLAGWTSGGLLTNIRLEGLTLTNDTLKIPSNAYGKLVIQLSQSGTNDPTATTVLNTTGRTYTLARTGVGVYTITMSGATGWSTVQDHSFGQSYPSFNASVVVDQMDIGTNIITIRTFSDALTLETPADGLITTNKPKLLVIDFY